MPTIAEAIKQVLQSADSGATAEQIKHAIAAKFRDQWKPSAIQSHLYGCVINRPKAHVHHPYSEKFLYRNSDGTFDLYSEKLHGPNKWAPAIFTREEHRLALIRRRIKFVVEKGAMARLFRKGTHGALQKELFCRIKPDELKCIQTRADYDKWLFATVKGRRWELFSRNGLAEDRWAYFAKLVNIVVYEILANRELFLEADWKRLRPFLHIPIDATIMCHLSKVAPDFPVVKRLKGMTEAEYKCVQEAVRVLGESKGVPPIWFEAAYSQPAVGRMEPD